MIAANKPVKKVEPIKTRKDFRQKEVLSHNNIAAHKEGLTTNMAASPAPVQQPVMMSRTFTATDTTLHLQGKVDGQLVNPAIFSGKVLDQNGDPVPYATIRLNNRQSVADAKGNFNVLADDTSSLITTSAVGYSSQTSSIKPNKPDTITIAKNDATLGEVATMAFGAAKRSKPLSDSAMPVGGWKNFNNYVTEQLNKDTTAESVTNPDDVVEIEFLIDNMGNPYDFKVTKSLDDQHDAKAIDILKNGPKWTNPSKKKKARVAINF
jgi:hypothetical protein